MLTVAGLFRSRVKTTRQLVPAHRYTQIEQILHVVEEWLLTPTICETTTDRLPATSNNQKHSEANTNVPSLRQLPTNPTVTDWQRILPFLGKALSHSYLDHVILTAADSALVHHYTTSTCDDDQLEFELNASYQRIQNATLDTQATLAQLTIDTDLALRINSRDGFSLLTSRTSTTSHSFMATDQPKIAELTDTANPSPILRTTTKKKSSQEKLTQKPSDTTLGRHISAVVDEVLNPLPSSITKPTRPTDAPKAAKQTTESSKAPQPSAATQSDAAKSAKLATDTVAPQTTTQKQPEASQSTSTQSATSRVDPPVHNPLNGNPQPTSSATLLKVAEQAPRPPDTEAVRPTPAVLEDIAEQDDEAADDVATAISSDDDFDPTALPTWTPYPPPEYVPNKYSEVAHHFITQARSCGTTVEAAKLTKIRQRYGVLREVRNITVVHLPWLTGVINHNEQWLIKADRYLKQLYKWHPTFHKHSKQAECNYLVDAKSIQADCDYTRTRLADFQREHTEFYDINEYAVREVQRMKAVLKLEQSDTASVASSISVLSAAAVHYANTHTKATSHPLSTTSDLPQSHATFNPFEKPPDLATTTSMEVNSYPLPRVTGSELFALFQRYDSAYTREVSVFQIRCNLVAPGFDTLTQGTTFREYYDAERVALDQHSRTQSVTTAMATKLFDNAERRLILKRTTLIQQISEAYRKQAPAEKPITGNDIAQYLIDYEDHYTAEQAALKQVADLLPLAEYHPFTHDFQQFRSKERASLEAHLSSDPSTTKSRADAIFQAAKDALVTKRQEQTVLLNEHRLRLTAKAAKAAEAERLAAVERERQTQIAAEKERKRLAQKAEQDELDKRARAAKQTADAARVTALQDLDDEGARLDEEIKRATADETRRIEDITQHDAEQRRVAQLAVDAALAMKLAADEHLAKQAADDRTAKHAGNLPALTAQPIVIQLHDRQMLATPRYVQQRVGKHHRYRSTIVLDPIAEYPVPAHSTHLPAPSTIFPLDATFKPHYVAPAPAPIAYAAPIPNAAVPPPIKPAAEPPDKGGHNPANGGGNAPAGGAGGRPPGGQPSSDSDSDNDKRERRRAKRERRAYKRRDEAKRLARRMNELNNAEARDHAAHESHPHFSTSSSSSSPSSSSSSSDSTSSSGSSTEEDETIVGDSKYPMTKRDKRRCAQFKPFKGKNDTCDLKIFHGLPLYNPFGPNEEHINFSPWHTNFVARCNIARHSYSVRKYALHVMTEGKAQDFLMNIHNRKYSYQYKHLIQQYGNGSPHVGYQEEYDTLAQHDEERLEEFAARWKQAFRRRFGRSFKVDTKKNMADLIRLLANDYVKAHLAALKLKKFDDVIRHGRRLEKEAATYGYVTKFGATTTPTSHPSDYSRRREASKLYTTEKPAKQAPSTKSTWSRPRWRNLTRSFTKTAPAANSTTVSAANPSSDQLASQKTAVHQSEDGDSDSNEQPLSEFDDDDAQFICFVETQLADIFEVAAKPTSDKTLQERLRNDVAHLSVRLDELENQFRQKRQGQSAVSSPMYNTTSVVTGKCWHCGKEGHSWRRCPTRTNDVTSTLQFKPAGTDERVTQMRVFTRKGDVAKPTSTTKQVSAVNIVPTTACSEATWQSLQVAASFFSHLKEQQRNNHTTTSDRELIPNAIEDISEDHPLMTLPRLFAVGSINTVEFSCLFDTGAATNLLSLCIYNSLPNAPPLTAATSQFNTAAGTPLDVLGRALCTFTISTKTTCTPFYVVRNLVGAALLGMPYLSQAGVIIHAATQEIQFDDDVRLPALTLQADTNVHQVASFCVDQLKSYDCSVSTVCSLYIQPLVTYVTLNRNVLIPACTAQIVECSIPGNSPIAGYLEPHDTIEPESGLLVARIYIPSSTPVRGIVRLWVVNIHDVARKLLSGNVACIISHDNESVSAATSVPIARTPTNRGTFNVQTQTDPDPRFPHEYLHVPVPVNELPGHARFQPGDPDHPDTNPIRKQLRTVPWVNTMLFPPPKLPRTEVDLLKVYDAIKLSDTDLSPADQERVRKLFANWYYRRLVAVQPDDLGRCGLVRVRYDLLPGEHGPIRVPPRRIPPERLPGAYETVDKWLRTNTIQPSTSPFTFPPVFVPKPHTNNTKWRMCVDYRQLNDKSVKFALPLPRCDEVVSSVRGAKYFTTLDLQWGFLQMENEPETAEYTAFTIPGRHYHFNVLPFGVTNGPGVFQRLMSTVLDGLLGIYALNYIDDILITGTTIDEICLHMNIVFDRLEQANLMVGYEKVFPCRRSRVFLGFLLDEHGIRPDPEKVKAFHTMSPPQTFYQVRQLIGFLNFNAMMVPKLSIMLHPITQLLQNLPTGAGKKPRPNTPPPACELLGDRWSTEQQNAFDSIRDALTNAVAVAYPDPHGLFVLSTDASLLGIGAILQQFQPVLDQPDQQELRTLAFASRPLTRAEHNYAATKLELLAVVSFVRRFHQYLVGRRFILLTDHYALQWLFTSMSTSEGIMARWITQLSVYDIAVFYRKGTDNTAADFLSRRTYTDKDLRMLLLDPDMHVTSGKAKPRNQDQATQSDAAGNVAAVLTSPVHEISSTLSSSELRDQLLNHVAFISEVQTAKTVQSDVVFGLPTDWQLEQQLDHSITYVRQHFYDIAPPADLDDQPDDTKRLWAQRGNLLAESDTLFYQSRKPAPEFAALPRLTKCLVVPVKWRVPLTTFYHAAKNMAHAGPHQTYRRMLSSYWWPTIKNDIKTILSQCDICQRVKTGPTNLHAPLQPIRTNDVFERVHIDLIGPMANSHGYRYVLVIIDAFSRWLEAVPLTNKRAETVAWALLTTWICRYGWMQILHSDNGTEFVNAVMNDLCNWLGIVRTTTTAYHPQGNGMCERANRSLKQALTCLLLEHGTGWFKALPLALWSIRSAIHRVTGYTPFQVLFARHMRSPYDYNHILDPTLSTTPYEPPSNPRATHNIATDELSMLDDASKATTDVAPTTQIASSAQSNVAADLDLDPPPLERVSTIPVDAHFYALSSLAQISAVATRLSKCLPSDPSVLEPTPATSDFAIQPTPTSDRLYCDYIEALVQLFANIHARVRTEISNSVAHIKKQYDKKAKRRYFQPGQEVLVKLPIRPASENPGEKFYPRWHGPLTVLFAYDDRTIYRLIDPITREQRSENVNNLKPYTNPATRHLQPELLSSTQLTPQPRRVIVSAIYNADVAHQGVYVRFRILPKLSAPVRVDLDLHTRTCVADASDKKRVGGNMPAATRQRALAHPYKMRAPLRCASRCTSFAQIDAQSEFNFIVKSSDAERTQIVRISSPIYTNSAAYGTFLLRPSLPLTVTIIFHTFHHKMASNSAGTKQQSSIGQLETTTANTDATTKRTSNTVDESGLTAAKKKQLTDKAWTDVHETIQTDEYTGRLLDDGVDKLYVLDALTDKIDPARNTTVDQPIPDTPAAKYYHQVLGQIRPLKPQPTLLQLAAQVYKQPDTSEKLLAGASSNAASTSGNVASLLGNVAPTNRVASAQLIPSSSTGEAIFNQVFASITRKKQVRAARTLTFQHATNYLDEIGIQLHPPGNMGPLDLPTDDERLRNYKSWMRSVKTMTSALRLPFLFEADMPVAIQEAKAKKARKGKKAENTVQPTNYSLIHALNAYDAWIGDTAETLILPPPITYYSGWPRSPYAFNYLVGVQEVNFIWTDFLYAYIRADGRSTLQLGKWLATLGVYGVVIECADNKHATAYRLRFRGLEHILRVLMAYTTFDVDENGDNVYEDYYGHQVRSFDRCLALPLIFSFNSTIQTDEREDVDSLLASHLFYAYDVFAQRLELVEDTLPAAQQPKWWRPKPARFTQDELFAWIQGEKNRAMTQEGWDHFNSKAVYRVNGQPASIVSVTPAAGQINKMTASGWRVYYLPNTIKPVTINVSYSKDLAPESSFVIQCQEVIRACNEARRHTDRDYTLQYLVQKLQQRDDTSAFYQILPTKGTGEYAITGEQATRWHAEVLNTYASRAQDGHYGVPFHALPADLQAIANQGEENEARYKATYPTGITAPPQPTTSPKSTTQLHTSTAAPPTSKATSRAKKVPSAASNATSQTTQVTSPKSPATTKPKPTSKRTHDVIPSTVVEHPATKRTRCNPSAAATAPRQVSSDTSLAVHDLYDQVDAVATLTHSRSNLLCQSLPHVYEEMRAAYDNCRSALDTLRTQIHQKARCPSNPKRSMSELDLLAERITICQDALHAVHKRPRLYPGKTEASTALPPHTNNMLHTQLDQLDAAIVERNKQYDALPPSHANRAILAKERKILTSRSDAIRQFLHKFFPDGNPRPQDASTKQHGPSTSKSISNASSAHNHQEAVGRRTRSRRHPTCCETPAKNDAEKACASAR